MPIVVREKKKLKKREKSHLRFKEVATDSITNNNGVLFCRQVQLTQFYLLAGVSVN